MEFIEKSKYPYVNIDCGGSPVSCSLLSEAFVICFLLSTEILRQAAQDAGELLQTHIDFCAPEKDKEWKQYLPCLP